MYGYAWTDRNGIFRLSLDSRIQKEIRPVFREELDYFGLDAHWTYPQTDAPLLWAEGTRRYVANGTCTAEAVGGGFYTKPVIHLREEHLTLAPVDTDDLWAENERILRGLERTAMDAIRSCYDRYAARGMAFVVAFSGGKDSLVLLDLVSRTLSPDRFSVVFSDTGMELSATYDAVARAKAHWPSLRFYTAKSHLSPAESWEEFGPPGRRMRWCCSVHKSVPTILTLRELTGDYNIKAVVFDGVRAEESTQRAAYDEIGIGEKNINQINCHPILKWNSAELYIYLLKHEILFNQAYRYGLSRVGCTVCPLSSDWRDGIANDLYGEELQPLLDKVERMAAWAKPKSEVKKYIEQGGWKTRMGGKILPNGANRVNESIQNDVISFTFSENRQNWLSVAPLLGAIVGYQDGRGTQIIDHRMFQFEISTEGSLTVSYSPYSQMDRFTLSHLRGVANKVAYCIGCKTCCVQCPAGAFAIDDEGKIFIRTEKCTHCSNCLTFTNRGCFVAKSLMITGGTEMELKGMDRYKTFGLERPWLEHFFERKEACFTAGVLGNRQYDALKVWLREAGLLSPAGKGEKAGVPTALFEKLEPLGAGHPLVWAVIWTNLAYRSVIARWYMLTVPAGETFEKSELVFRLGDDYSKRTRDNAVAALLETLKQSPIGSVLRQGIPLSSGKGKYSRSGWNTPDAVAVLYALYLWAETMNRYEFTLSQLAAARGNADVKGVDPVTIYGIDPDRFRDILQSIAIQYPDYIRTTFVADLDNVKLFPAFGSMDILDLIAG